MLFSVLFCLTAFNTFLNQQLTTEIKIGEQIWMGENLNVERFSNGDIIKEAKTNQEWMNYCASEKPAWCYYDNDSKNGLKYGKLYNVYALLDKRGLAPKGWHIPKHEEWKQLENYLGKEKAGQKLKSKLGWKKGVSTNLVGFSALPSGFRYGDGTFMDLNIDCAWWAIPESQDDFKFKESNAHSLHEESNELVWLRIDWGVGYSVRCVKN